MLTARPSEKVAHGRRRWRRAHTHTDGRAVGAARGGGGAPWSAHQRLCPSARPGNNTTNGTLLSHDLLSLEHNGGLRLRCLV